MSRIDPELVEKVQFNCDLSDARYAGRYTLCVYLLKMREYYRWRHGIPFNQTLPMSDVGEWVHQTEGLWDEIESREFEALPVSGQRFDVFDDAAINARLAAEQLVFSSGLGRFGKPVFFLGQRLEYRRGEGFSIYICGEEYARELAAPPAMIRGENIFIRRQSLERMLWEQIEEWRWQRKPGPMEKVYAHYDFDHDPRVAMTSLLDDQVDLLLLHEQGEFMAGNLLGAQWEEMLVAVSGTTAEDFARAVRDCLADSLVVLPSLIGRDRPELLHCYFAGLSALRKELLEHLLDAYRACSCGTALCRLEPVVEQARQHFTEMARLMLRKQREGSPIAESATGAIQEYRFHHP
jgi:hypothetical protein